MKNKENWNSEVRELSLHILDIVENSIAANASEIQIVIKESPERDEMEIMIIDNGKGMNPEQLASITDPFYTTRTTRKLGFGIPFFKDTTEQSGGRFLIESELGKGTKITAKMQLNHINRPPLGNMPETIQTLVFANPAIKIKYEHEVNQKKFSFDSKQYQNMFSESGNVSFSILHQMKKDIEEGLKALHRE